MLVPNYHEHPKSSSVVLPAISQFQQKKKTAQLAEMQEFFNIEQKKMFKFFATRWLSMQHAVKRIIDNWEVLLNYFRLANFEENSK
jgi:hypothetical protein